MTLFDHAALNGQFYEIFGSAAQQIVRAPGRLNLIGEHTDYAQLPVLPIAIEQSVYVAASSSDDASIIAVSRQFDGRFDVHEPATEPWHRYLRAVLAQLEPAEGRGARLLIDSDLPATGGLASSSALTMAVVEALNVTWGLQLSRAEVVAKAVEAERWASAEVGAMDQNVIAFAEAGHASHIEFLPPSRRQVAVPPGVAFVVAYSGETAPKVGEIRDAYNERVVGSRIAASMLADEVGVDLEDTPTLGQVADIDVIDILSDGLPEKVSAQEVAHGVRVDVERLVRLTSERWTHQAKVPVRKIALHILSEARRVGEAEAALAGGDFGAFGALLDASHDSLRQEMRCSTPALDKVAAAMRRAGAYGARLTGAGFGGHAFAAVPLEKVADVIEAAVAATGGPAFEVRPAQGMELI